VLARRCAEVERDPSTLETSALVAVVLDDVEGPTPIPAELEGLIGRGSPDQIADQIQTKVFNVGLSSVIIHAASQGHIPGVVTDLGTALRQSFDA
jgi:hypothetical protein